MYLDNIDSGFLTFFSNGMGFISLDDDNFDEDDPANIVLVKPIASLWVDCWLVVGSSPVAVN